MRIGLFGLAIFLAGIAPGLMKHGSSDRSIARPVQASIEAAEKPGLLSLLARRKKTG
jgi:hypothetical protein